VGRQCKRVTKFDFSFEFDDSSESDQEINTEYGGEEHEDGGEDKDIDDEDGEEADQNEEVEKVDNKEVEQNEEDEKKKDLTGKEDPEAEHLFGSGKLRGSKNESERTPATTGRRRRHRLEVHKLSNGKVST